MLNKLNNIEYHLMIDIYLHWSKIYKDSSHYIKLLKIIFY